MLRSLGTKAYLALALGLLFGLLSIVVVVLVNMTMKRLALHDAEHAARMLLDHNLAIHTYFTKDLKPKLFEQFGPTTSKDYFEPTWMSSTYAVRKMDGYFRHFNENPYYYKESAINARSPENEADAYEKAFLKDLQNNPQLTNKSAIRVLDGKPYFTFLRRGESMEESCLRCHSTPEQAPGDMVRRYGPERSFHRKLEDVAQAISIRIPLSEAFSSATSFSWYLSGLLLLSLGGGFLLVWVGNKRLLIRPMAEIQEHAVRIASEPERLGDTIPMPKVSELRDLVVAFNKMSVELRRTYDEQEQRILERTRELAEANRQLEKEVESRLKAAEALLVSETQYRAVFDNASVGIDLFDRNGKTVKVNSALMNLLGYTEEEFMRSNLLDMTHPEDNEISKRKLEVLMAGEIDSYRLEKRYVRKDGGIVWVDLWTGTIRDARGDHSGAVSVIADITERKKFEKELEESRAELEAIYEYAPVMMCVLDGQRNVLYANRAFVDFVGRTEAELKEGRACGVFGCINALDDPGGCGYGPNCGACSLRLAIDGTYKTGLGHRAVEYRSTLVGKEGRREVVLLGSTALIHSRDRSSVLLCLEDITKRERAAMALRESEERFRKVFEQGPLGVAVLDLDYRWVSVNPRLCEMLGYSEAELLKRTFVDVTHPDDIQEDLRQSGRLVSGEIPVKKTEKRYIKKNGQTLWISLTATLVRDEQGEPVYFLAMVEDISERKHAEEALRTTLQRFYTILSSFYSGVLIVTEESRVEFANQAFCNMFDLEVPPESLHGLAAPEMIAKIQDVYAEPAAAVARIREVVGKRRPVKGEQIAMRGGRTYMRDYVPLFVDGKGAGRLWYHNDITYLKKAEEEREGLKDQLLQAQKMEAIGTLTGGIAHDFNNLLTVINGFTEMILLEKTEDDPIYADLQKILQTGQKGADMVQRLLSFTKQSASNLEPIDLNQRIEEGKKLMEAAFPKMIEIETILAADLATIKADAGQIDQVLMNLCVNAKDAMPDGGRLRIETRNMIVDEDYCRHNIQAKPGRYVLVEVSDTGKGMNAETMARIFDPFFTTKGWNFRKGTGLGLPVVKGIVEQHGGWTTCRSEPGRGTTIAVWFPVIVSSPQIQEPEPPTDSALTEEKILLVDDEELIRDLGKRILERSAYTVITAANGKEALDIYTREQSDIALVVLDIIMPEMEGKQCLYRLLKINPLVKVIISSGHSLDADEREQLGAFVKGFVNKPYEGRQLVQAIKEALKSKGSTGS